MGVLKCPKAGGIMEDFIDKLIFEKGLWKDGKNVEKWSWRQGVSTWRTEAHRLWAWYVTVVSPNFSKTAPFGNLLGPSSHCLLKVPTCPKINLYLPPLRVVIVLLI